jgi:hypothetical protein
MNRGKWGTRPQRLGTAVPMRRLSPAIVPLLLLVLVSTPNVASAATFTGTTSQGRAASVLVNDAGVVTRVRIHWRAACGRQGYRYTGPTGFRDPFDHQSPDEVRDAGTYTQRFTDAKARVTVSMQARRTSTYRWKGTFAARAVVRRKNGKLITRCRLPKMTWTTSTPEVSVTMTGDNGDYITGGRSYSYATPQDLVPVTGNRRFLRAGIGPFDLEIEPPSGRTLEPDTFSTTRYPFNDDGGGLNVSGDGRGCNTSTGTVTVESSRFDRRGDLVAMVVAFEQHCEGGTDALRGRLIFRR